MSFFVFLIGAGIVFYAARKAVFVPKKKLPKRAFPKVWRNFLSKNIPYYKGLSKEEKTDFEHQVHIFLLNTKITGIKTSVDDSIRLYVAASAIIPIFRFKNWEYHFLNEVLIYPSAFNLNYQFKGQGLNAIGLVGSGAMEGKMILAKDALVKGFSNTSDKKNVGVHEFIHLIDKQDGVIDGVPEALLNEIPKIAWLDLIETKIEEIKEEESNIRDYGATNRQEFFSVASEYFFERPKLMEQHHPKLYKTLEKVFNVDMINNNENWKGNIVKEIGRNDDCPCGSGEKYKKCCLKFNQ